MILGRREPLTSYAATYVVSSRRKPRAKSLWADGKTGNNPSFCWYVWRLEGLGEEKEPFTSTVLAGKFFPEKTKGEVYLGRGGKKGNNKMPSKSETNLASRATWESSPTLTRGRSFTMLGSNVTRTATTPWMKSHRCPLHARALR